MYNVQCIRLLEDLVCKLKYVNKENKDKSNFNEEYFFETKFSTKK